MVKNLPAVLETWVQSLGQEDTLEKGNGYPLQYSCLENSIDSGAWQATFHGVTELDTTELLTLSLFIPFKEVSPLSLLPNMHACLPPFLPSFLPFLLFFSLLLPSILPFLLLFVF